jgi:hypothetical protein
VPNDYSQAVEFWAWVMSDPNITAQLERSPRRWQFPYSDVAKELESVTVNGVPVLEESGEGGVDERSKASLVLWIGVGAGSCVLVCAACAAFLAYRNRQLADRVQRMRTELEEVEDVEWDKGAPPDVETPLAKVMDFLQVMIRKSPPTHYD